MVWVRRVGIALLVLLGLVATLAIGFGVWLRTETGREWLLAQILGAIDPPNGDLVVGSLETDIFSGLVLHDVELRDASGKTLLSADEVRARYRLGGLPGRMLRVTDVEIVGLRGELAITDAGLDLANLWPSDPDAPSGGPYEGLPIDIVVDRVAV